MSSRPERISASVRQASSSLQHHRGDRQAGLAGEPQQFVAGAEGVFEGGVVRDDRVLPGHRVLVHHEAAADRVVRLLQDRRALAVVREDRHAVGVVRERLAAVQDQVVVEGERDLVHAQQVDPAGGADLVDARVRRLHVDRLRRLALQAEQDRLGRPVSVPGRAEGAVQLGPYRGGVREQALVLQAAREHPGGAHRSHRVGAGGADTDREEVEDRDGHGRTPWGVGRRRCLPGGAGQAGEKPIRGQGTGHRAHFSPVCAVPRPNARNRRPGATSARGTAGTSRPVPRRGP